MTDLARLIDDELLAFIAAERSELEPEALPLLDELQALVAAGGKRLRPRFAYWGFRAAGGADDERIARVGASLELLHTMALITDDVMDRSATRRNRPSTASSLGPSAAILCGMLGFVLADRLFSRSVAGMAGARDATERYDRLRTDAIAGQYLDLLAAKQGNADEPTTRRIASLKSGRYTVADPLAIGASLAGASPSVIDALERYGVPLGEAFQIRDDILSTFGEATGKDRDGDIREGKQTVLLAKACSLATPDGLARIDGVVGHASSTAQDIDDVRRLFESTGALQETETLIDELTTLAKDAITAAPVEADARDALLALADESTVRTS